MEEVEQLKISPSELYFPPPHNRVVSNVLKLHNASSRQTMAYKVKTTAPKRYCVRPNVGFVPPGEVIEISVLLNPQKDPPSAKSKDKFQILSLVVDTDNIPTADVSVLKDVWNDPPTDKVIKQRLKCYFSAAPLNKKRRSSQQLDSFNGGATQDPFQTIEDYEPALKSFDQTPAPTTTNPDSTTSTPTDSQIPDTSDHTNMDDTPTDDLSLLRSANQESASQIQLLSNENKKLKDKLAELSEQNTGLRQRRSDKSSSSSDATTVVRSSGGYSQQIVILIALIMLFLGIVIGKMT